MKRFQGVSGVVLVCGLLAAQAQESSRAGIEFTSPRLSVVTSWLGNTYPGAERWVPQDIDALCVAPDGRLFSNVH